MKIENITIAALKESAKNDVGCWGGGRGFAALGTNSPTKQHVLFAQARDLNWRSRSAASVPTRAR